MDAVGMRLNEMRESLFAGEHVTAVAGTGTTELVTQYVYPGEEPDWVLLSNELTLAFSAFGVTDFEVELGKVLTRNIRTHVQLGMTIERETSSDFIVRLYEPDWMRITRMRLEFLQRNIQFDRLILIKYLSPPDIRTNPSDTALYMYQRKLNKLENRSLEFINDHPDDKYIYKGTPPLPLVLEAKRSKAGIALI